MEALAHTDWTAEWEEDRLREVVNDFRHPRGLRAARATPSSGTRTTWRTAAF